MVEFFSHKSSIVSLSSANPFSFPFSTNLHKENAGFIFHYWRRREPPVPLSIADFRSAFIVYGHFLFFILVLPKICNGKTKGLGTFPIYIRKPHVFFPLLAATAAASIPQYRIFFALKIRVSQKRFHFWIGRKICNGKTKGLGTFLRFSLAVYKVSVCFVLFANFLARKNFFVVWLSTLTIDTHNRHLQ